MTTNNVTNDGNLYSAGDGKVLIARASGQAIPANIIAGTGISVINGTNSITIATSGGGSGGYRLISSQSASSSSSITFSSLTSSYSAYQVIVTNIQNATNAANLNLRMNSDSSSVYQFCTYLQSSGASQGTNASGGTTSITLIPSMSNSAYQSALTLTVYNPSNSGYCNCNWIASYTDSGPTFHFATGSGFYGAAGPVTSITFIMSSGNITAGNFYLYGIVNS